MTRIREIPRVIGIYKKRDEGERGKKEKEYYNSFEKSKYFSQLLCS